jgi:hypothetical protein
MGFKFGMLRLAYSRREYVIDQEIDELARVFASAESGHFFLRYLDGRKALLQMNFHMQWYPLYLEEQVTVLTEEELRIFTIRQERVSRLQKHIMEKRRDRILFGESPDLRQSLRGEGILEAETIW